MQSRQLILGLAAFAVVAIAAPAIGGGSGPPADSSASAKKTAKKALKLAKKNKAAIGAVELTPGPKGADGADGIDGVSGYDERQDVTFVTDPWLDGTVRSFTSVCDTGKKVISGGAQVNQAYSGDPNTSPNLKDEVTLNSSHPTENGADGGWQSGLRNESGETLTLTTVVSRVICADVE